MNYLDTSSESKNVRKISQTPPPPPPPPTRHHLFLMETEAELEKLTNTMKAFQKQPVAPPRQFSRQISFGSAQTGNVSHAKRVFEKKLDEEVENLTLENPNYSPFRPLYTPTNGGGGSSTRATPLSMRRRSPSPVVTGNVSRARMRFESGGSVKSSATPTPIEPLSHQTLPRTFRMSQNSQNLEKSAINRFLSGSTNKISNSTLNSTSTQNSTHYFTPLENYQRRNYNVDSAAKFLTETLPSYSG